MDPPLADRPADRKAGLDQISGVGTLHSECYDFPTGVKPVPWGKIEQLHRSVRIGGRGVSSQPHYLSRFVLTVWDLTLTAWNEGVRDGISRATW
jgi:hypothetical protein